MPATNPEKLPKSLRLGAILGGEPNHTADPASQNQGEATVIANQRTSSLAPDDPGTPPAKRNRPSTLPPLPADLLAGLEARGLLYLAALIDRRSSWFHETYHDQEAREVFYRYLLIHPRLQAPIQTLYAEIVPEGALSHDQSPPSASGGFSRGTPRRQIPRWTEESSASPPRTDP